MICSSVLPDKPSVAVTACKMLKPPPKPSPLCAGPILCTQNKNPNTMNKPSKKPKVTIASPILVIPSPVSEGRLRKNRGCEERKDFLQVGGRQMAGLCGFGYWVQGFRCFPWLALNFHMARNLKLPPSTLQLVQYSGNLPMVAKPLYGILSDAIYVGGAHRLPYLSAGVLLQVLSWGPLALIPLAREALPNLVACVLLSNIGASISEVAMDALVAEYGQKHNLRGLQSYAFMASAAGGILGNLLGGYILLRTPPKDMFFIFTCLLSLQFAMSLMTKEASLGVSQPSVNTLKKKSILLSIRNQLSDLLRAVREESISGPLAWIVLSIMMVPILSGSIFCFQTQCLHLDPTVIGMSRVIGQLLLLFTSILFDRYWKNISMRRLIGVVQVLYACLLLLDLVLVRQINLKLGIPNDVFSLCFSGLAETIAQFKLLPFSVLFANLCPQGCEGSLTSFLASALCLSSIFSGFLGVGLASLIRITSGDYSSLPVGILIQFMVALLPMAWIHLLPVSLNTVEKDRKRGLSKRRRRNRRVGRVVFGSVISYRRERV
ncbi:probable folate-biopterin transporter 8, chloroplastic isoform X1 [Syzygium oleosum]|uniref:probable folate-biopterin transporter 8, chloroplastic isoform X1 n=1 Tax=Syzygium oleosum TaxID=219896 RepID=UPI0011D1D8AB|nr:probable folate-biopterin transporter 8, chloroplastic isoform X1 [Syzygium oleosum]